MQMENVTKRDFWRNFKMEEKIIEIIENLTGYKKLKENRDIDLLDNEILDSLAFIELITSLEEEFDIEIPDADAEKVTTVNDVVEYIKENVQ